MSFDQPKGDPRAPDRSAAGDRPCDRFVDAPTRTRFREGNSYPGIVLRKDFHG